MKEEGRTMPVSIRPVESRSERGQHIRSQLRLRQTHSVQCYPPGHKAFTLTPVLPSCHAAVCAIFTTAALLAE